MDNLDWLGLLKFTSTFDIKSLFFLRPLRANDNLCDFSFQTYLTIIIQFPMNYQPCQTIRWHGSMFGESCCHRRQNPGIEPCIVRICNRRPFANKIRIKLGLLGITNMLEHLMGFLPRSSAVGHYCNWDILCDQYSGIEAHLLYCMTHYQSTIRFNFAFNSTHSAVT